MFKVLVVGLVFFFKVRVKHLDFSFLQVFSAKDFMEQQQHGWKLKMEIGRNEAKSTKMLSY